MKKTFILFSCFGFSIYAAIAQLIDRDTLSTAVVQLEQKLVEKVTVEGREAEIWLKFTGDANPRPKINTSLGTGLLVKGTERLLIVTAGHVAKTLTRDASVILKGQDDKPVTLSFRDLVGTALADWQFHPTADIAIHILEPGQDVVSRHLQKRFLPVEILATDRSAPSRDLPLTVIGFPLGLGSKEYFSPLTLETKAASGLLTILRFDTKQPATFFLLQNPSVGGYSGAPCFDVSVYKLNAMQTTGSGTKWFGIIHGTVSDDTGGKLAAVVPSYEIAEFIKKYDVK